MFKITPLIFILGWMTGSLLFLVRVTVCQFNTFSLNIDILRYNRFLMRVFLGVRRCTIIGFHIKFTVFSFICFHNSCYRIWENFYSKHLEIKTDILSWKKFAWCCRIYRKTTSTFKINPCIHNGRKRNYCLKLNLQHVWYKFEVWFSNVQFDFNNVAESDSEMLQPAPHAGQVITYLVLSLLRYCIWIHSI